MISRPAGFAPCGIFIRFKRINYRIYGVMGKGTLVHSLGSMNLSPMIQESKTEKQLNSFILK